MTASLFAYCYPSVNSDRAIREDYWQAQTFLTETSHFCLYVKLYLKSSGLEEDILLTVEIRETSGDTPTGTILASISMNKTELLDAGLTEDNSYSLVKIKDFSEPLQLSSGTKYAIVARSNLDVAELKLYWGARTSDICPDGRMCFFTTSWSCDSNWDLRFEEWGQEEYPLNLFESLTLESKIVSPRFQYIYENLAAIDLILSPRFQYLSENLEFLEDKLLFNRKTFEENLSLESVPFIGIAFLETLAFFFLLTKKTKKKLLEERILEIVIDQEG